MQTSFAAIPAAGAVLAVDLGAIAANFCDLARLHGPGATAAVLKADAYGLGAAAIAPALHAAGCRHFFVAYLEEALALRPLVPGAMLAVLNGLLPGTDMDYIADDLTPVLGSLAEIDQWRDAARNAGRPLSAILHVDTGMNRLGLDAVGVAALAASPERLDGIAIRYLMTHLVASEAPENPINRQQATRFAAACAGLPAAPRSIANSSGIFLGPEFASDLARPGAALYGINPTPGRPNPMRQSCRLCARVLAVHDIAAGERVGYNGIWAAPRRSRIATVSIGYADGFLRSQSNRGSAVFDGRAVPLVGRVSMDLTTFDVTDHPGIVPGAWLDLIGPGRTVDDVAQDACTNGYEVLTRFGPRIARVYR